MNIHEDINANQSNMDNRFFHGDLLQIKQNSISMSFKKICSSVRFQFSHSFYSALLLFFSFILFLLNNYFIEISLKVHSLNKQSFLMETVT